MMVFHLEFGKKRLLTTENYHMILDLYSQLVHTFVKQMPLNTPFSLITLENGINLIYNYMMQNLSRNLEMLKLGQLTPDLLYATHHSLGLKLLTRSRLGLSQLNPFTLDAPFLYPLKTSESLTVFCFLGGREKLYWEQMG